MSGPTTVPRRHDAGTGHDTGHEQAPAGGGTLDVERLYAEHRAGLVRLAALLVDDAELAADLVQDAFAAVVAHPAQVQAGRAGAYLRAAVVNRSRSALRRRGTARRHAAAPLSVAPAAPAEPGEGLLVAEEHRAVLDALHRLPERQREVLVLRYWAGLDEAGIAEAMGVARGTVKSTASRALAALEQHLGGTP